MKMDAGHITNVEQLKDEILSLRIRSERQKEHLQGTFLELKESVKPVNLARQTFGAIKNAAKNSDLVQTAFGLGGGMAARQILFGRSKGLLGRLWSAGAEIALSRFLSIRNRNGKGKASTNWFELLTGDESERKARIVLGKKEARFYPPARLLPAVGN